MDDAEIRELFKPRFVDFQGNDTFRAKEAFVGTLHVGPGAGSYFCETMRWRSDPRAKPA
jgi:hypothetical protein